ncbi:hypothetical protein O3G_MSEX009317 [Manduca sexta]|uniref:tRNA pseudouridine(55) synthase n=1 Tax=Manduca sexta TaxID=7130 RepID=A0A921ZD41_MANSE|nr:hypothetical protein O3G_MSEX009317 [Manduca sexta]
MSKDINQTDIINFCKELGCCNACSLRYAGNKNPTAYENASEFVPKQQETTDSQNAIPADQQATNGSVDANTETIDNDEPACKKRKLDVCISCLGILQGRYWLESIEMVKDVLEKKRYACKTFACGLSSPISALLREKAITLRLGDKFKDYDGNCLTALKEAWKWSFASKLAEHVSMTLDSGAISPLLVTLNMEYPQDLQELEILKTLSPALFQSRSKQKRRFTVEFTRRSVEQALENVTHEALEAVEGKGLPAVESAAKCVSVVCVHAPGYLGGRYIKLSRELPQTPWLVNGVRMMESSVQEIIFEPIAKLYEMSPEEMEHRMKFMSAGREDVDVRCLGDGRPFAVEITDPRREPSEEELRRICEEISKGGKVVVKSLIPVTREDLTELKKGEETKCKTYEALCIKLGHADGDKVANGDTPIVVTEQDLHNINTYRNTPEGDEARILIKQKTPIRVLHRRPLLTRSRRIYDLEATAVPGHPQLFRLRVRTEAGTYVKEWVHSELRRSRPALPHALRARADILALDVAVVHLRWPNI